MDNPQRIRRWSLAASYGLMVYALLPAVVAVFNDDFGYLRSVVQTLQHGRPWTDDWLEPWAASFSGLSALLYLVSENFHLATYGLLGVLAALAFGAAATRFSALGFPSDLALGLAALLLTFPTLLWKSAEFNGVALYLPCLLLALGAADRHRWGWFLLWWGLALATRQSALTWGVLPAVELVRLLLNRREDRAKMRAMVVLAVLAGGTALFIVLQQRMNLTHAQAMVTRHVIERIDVREAMGVLLSGGWVFLCAIGIGAYLGHWRGIGSQECLWPVGRNFLHWLVGLAVLVLFVGGVLDRVGVEHLLFEGPVGRMEVALGLGLALTGWGLRRFSLRWSYALAALASLLLVATRGVAWDYYFIDAALLGLFAVKADAQSSDSPVPMPALRRVYWYAPLLALAGMHLLHFTGLKCTLDRAASLCVVSEQALREKRLDPSEISYAPFGFSAWHLYPYYIAHEGREDRNLAGFGGYLRPGAVEVGQGYSRALHVFPRFRHEPPAERSNLIAFGGGRFAWFFRAEFYLLRFKTEAEAPAPMRIEPEHFSAQQFPLNEAEWRDLIRSGRR